MNCKLRVEETFYDQSEQNHKTELIKRKVAMAEFPSQWGSHAFFFSVQKQLCFFFFLIHFIVRKRSVGLINYGSEVLLYKSCARDSITRFVDQS